MALIHLNGNLGLFIWHHYYHLFGTRDVNYVLMNFFLLILQSACLNILLLIRLALLFHKWKFDERIPILKILSILRSTKCSIVRLNCWGLVGLFVCIWKTICLSIWIYSFHQLVWLFYPFFFSFCLSGVTQIGLMYWVSIDPYSVSKRLYEFGPLRLSAVSTVTI